MAAFVSDDDNPIDPVQVAIKNGAELSEPKRVQETVNMLKPLANTRCKIP